MPGLKTTLRTRTVMPKPNVHHWSFSRVCALLSDLRLQLKSQDGKSLLEVVLSLARTGDSRILFETKVVNCMEFPTTSCSTPATSFNGPYSEQPLPNVVFRLRVQCNGADIIVKLNGDQVFSEPIFNKDKFTHMTVKRNHMELKGVLITKCKTVKAPLKISSS